MNDTQKTARRKAEPRLTPKQSTRRQYTVERLASVIKRVEIQEIRPSAARDTAFKLLKGVPQAEWDAYLSDARAHIAKEQARVDAERPLHEYLEKVFPDG